MAKRFAVVIEKGKKDYIATVSRLYGCSARAKTPDVLMKSVTKAVKHYLKVEKDIVAVDFVGIHVIEVASKKFCAIMEKDMEYFIAYVPSLPGCFTQAETPNGLIKNIREAAELYLEVKKDNEKVDFVGIQFVEV